MSLFSRLVFVSMCCISACSFAGAKPVYDKQIFELGSLTAVSFELSHSSVIFSSLDRERIVVEIEQVLKKGQQEKCIHVIKSERSENALRIYNQAQQHVGRSRCSVQRVITVMMGKGLIDKFALSVSHGELDAEVISFNHVELDYGHSQIQMANVQGDRIQLLAKHSGISIDDLIGETVDISGSHGTLNIHEAQFDLFDGRWAHGGVLIDESHANNVSLSLSHGNLTLAEHAGESVVVKGAHGRLSVQAKADRVELKNRHGAIDFSGSASSLSTKNQHGATHVVLAQTKPFSVNSFSRHGSIFITLPKDSAYHYEALSPNIRINNKIVRGIGYQKNNQSANNLTVKTSHGEAQIISF